MGLFLFGAHTHTGCRNGRTFAVAADAAFDNEDDGDVLCVLAVKLAAKRIPSVYIIIATSGPTTTMCDALTDGVTSDGF